MAIEAKVARAISSLELAFNVGSEAGVQEDDIATAYENKEIEDPDTQEPLGVYRRVLMQFRITFVDQKYSVGYSLDTVPNPEYTRNPAALISRVSQRITRRVTTNPQTGTSQQVAYVPLGCRVTIEKPASREKE